MTGEKRQHREAMIDETLIESFPASDSPSWTLGVDDSEAENATAPPKGGSYLRRNALLNLLSDEEVKRVGKMSEAPQLPDGEDYLDLARPERGVLRAHSSVPLVMGNVLPRSAVSGDTWLKLLNEVHRGWTVSPER